MHWLSYFIIFHAAIFLLRSYIFLLIFSHVKKIYVSHEVLQTSKFSWDLPVCKWKLSLSTKGWPLTYTGSALNSFNLVLKNHSIPIFPKYINYFLCILKKQMLSYFIFMNKSIKIFCKYFTNKMRFLIKFLV